MLIGELLLGEGVWRARGLNRQGTRSRSSVRSFSWIEGCLESKCIVQATPVAVVSCPAPRKVMTWSRMVSKLSCDSPSPPVSVALLLSVTMRAMMSLSLR